VAAIPPLVVIESDDDAVVGLEVVGDVIGGLPGAVAEGFVTGGLGEFQQHRRSVQAVDAHDDIALQLLADAFGGLEAGDFIQKDFFDPGVEVLRHLEVAVGVGAVGEQVADRVEAVVVRAAFRSGGNVLVEAAELLGLDRAIDQPVLACGAVAGVAVELVELGSKY
jgi:hypothetical protein